MRTDSEEGFFALADHGTSGLRGAEVLLLHFVGEETDFVRFNHALVRQPMTIRQAHLSITLISGMRRDSVTVTLTGDETEDRGRIGSVVSSLRDELASLPEDPYLLYSTEPTRSERIDRGTLPSRAEALEAIRRAADGTDLVGIYAAGPILRGFASSLGHRQWHEVDSFQFDWSLYHAVDKAVQSSFSTSSWDASALEARLDDARRTLEHLKKTPRTIAPGVYRAYLTPSAMAEVVAMLNWGGLSAKAQRTKTSCLQSLVDGRVALSPKFGIKENSAEGLAPSFDEVGFIKPGEVELVRGGRHAGALTSPRTAKEYGLAANADAQESLRSADLSPGELRISDALAALDTGVYVGNLWYLNFSDRANARITGMTRFATFWVENGEIVAPLEVMRFDDGIYQMLGENLLELTREREWQLSTSTYDQRSVETCRLPGALLSALTFTL